MTATLPLPSGAGAAPFELYGPLPSGTTLLEASAGTGKTYAIATLAARFVAEGCPLERLLVITFTRAATGELRSRVRERLVAARDGLDRALAGEEGEDPDELVALLRLGDDASVIERRDRLARALSQFDAATIDTTHGFCNRVLAELGVTGDAAGSPSLVEDVGDLLEEVVDDLYVRKYVRRGNPDLSRTDALELARRVLANPAARLTPELDGGDRPPSIRRRLAQAVRRETERRKAAAGLMTYDDVLLRLAEELADPRRGPAARTLLRSRYQIVLIDEFQDTDPVQWEIVQRAFGAPGTTLVLIGDPKQAIYAFRGADVQAYLEAAATASTRATLATNWRSDGPLVRALDALFGNAQLGERDILYRHVPATARNEDARLAGAPVTSALRLRTLTRDSVTTTGRGDAQTDAARNAVADDLAADVAALLSSPATIEDRPIRPGHVAVLVRTNKEAQLVRDVLARRGVPAVVVAPDSVFLTRPAAEWLSLLEALEQPASGPRAAAAALTGFLGWDARRLALADEEELDGLHGRLHEWSAVLRERGVASLLSAVEAETQLPARTLAHRDGERLLTDLHHVAELLHAEATRSGLGPAALATWLRQRIEEAHGPASTEAGAEERSRRLESDAASVQVLTVHRSKGLEFPVVYCPYLWVGSGSSGKDTLPVFHDPEAGGVRTLDVGGPRAALSTHLKAAIAEGLGEDLRLLYVALTRAQHQVVCWWAPSTNAGRSPLGRLLFTRDENGSVGDGGRTPEDDTVAARFAELADAAAGDVVIEAARPTVAAYRPAPRSDGVLALAHLERSLDSAWRRLSYTSLTAGAHDDVEVTDGRTEDEALSGGLLAAPEEAPLARLRVVPAALAEAPGGAAFGTVIHGVLERSDFAAPDLGAELRAHLDAELDWRRADVGDRAAIVHGLLSALGTPLGPSLGELRLVDLDRADRLDELGFELPLLGGDRPQAELDLAGLGQLLAEVLPPGDPVAAYAPRLLEPQVQASLRGYLTGSLDLVLRTPSGTYAVCDYKTNRLITGDGPLTAYDYRPSAVEAEMVRCHYPLQALLYLVALHRYLRWRLPGYEPAQHLGGAHYLFLRGMTGDAGARIGDRPCGIWSWQPPAGVVEAVSDLLDEGEP